MDENQTIKIVPQPGTEKLIIEHRPVQELKVHPWNVLSLETSDVESFVEVVRFRGTPENTIVTIDGQNTAKAILNDQVMVRPFDTVSMRITEGDEFGDWHTICGKKLTQKQMVDFLKNREPETVAGAENLIVTFARLKTITQIIGEYENDNDGNVHFMFKSQNGEGHASIPNLIYATIPVFESKDPLYQIMEFEVEFIRPKAETEKPLFVISCPRMNRYIKKASEHEMDKLRKELVGFTLLNNK